MKIKKFVAKSMPQALHQVREDLGANAVILSSRKVRHPSTSGVAGEEYVEVTAAVDESPDRPAPAVKTRSAAEVASRLYSSAEPTSSPLEPTVEAETPSLSSPKEYLQSSFSSRWREGSVHAATGDAGGLPPRDAGQADGDEILTQLHQLQEAIARLGPPTAPQPVLPPELGHIDEQLRAAGLGDELVWHCLRGLLSRLEGDGLGDGAAVTERILATLAEVLPGRRDIKIGNHRKVVGFFGSPGAGKTTAAVKIAAGFATRLRKRTGDSEPVLLVTTDGRRVGAVGQIRAFSEITGVPVEVAYDEAEMEAVLRRWPEVRLLLVDTAGCGPHEHGEIERQHRLLMAAEVDEVQAVIDSVSGPEHMLEVIESSRVFPVRRLLFAKVDHAVRPGVLLNVAASSGIATSYFAVSPGPPGGLEPGDLEALARKIVVGPPKTQKRCRDRAGHLASPLPTPVEEPPCLSREPEQAQRWS